MIKAAAMGDNSGAENGAQILAYIERVEQLESEIKALNDDKSDIYAEAKGNGYDSKIIKKIVGMRRQDKDKRIEEETILGLYMNAIGMVK